MIWGLLNLSEHPFLISKVWLIMPRVRICQGGPATYASSPFVVPSYVYHCARGSSTAVSRGQKQQCGSSEMKLPRTLAPCGTLSSFTLVLVLDKACREQCFGDAQELKNSHLMAVTKWAQRQNFQPQVNLKHAPADQLDFDLVSYRATQLAKSWPLNVVKDASISTCSVWRLFVIKHQLAKPNACDAGW